MRADLREAGERAVACLEWARDKHPDLSHEEVRKAVTAVVEFRNRVLGAAREGDADRDMLDRANAVMSLAYGAEFPLIGLKRERFAQARDTMAALIGSTPAR